MTEVTRISPQYAWEETRSGRAKLVCAYGDESKCTNLLLEGSISWPSFRNHLDSIDSNQEIILYCN